MGLGIGGEKVVDEGNQAGVFIISFYFTIYFSARRFPGDQIHRDLGHVNPLGLFL